MNNLLVDIKDMITKVEDYERVKKELEEYKHKEKSDNMMKKLKNYKSSGENIFGVYYVKRTKIYNLECSKFLEYKDVVNYLKDKGMKDSEYKGHSGRVRLTCEEFLELYEMMSPRIDDEDELKLLEESCKECVDELFYKENDSEEEYINLNNQIRKYREEYKKYKEKYDLI